MDGSQLKVFTCTACKRKFKSTQEDVDLAAGHLCMAADQGISQHEAIRMIQEMTRFGEDFGGQ